MKNGFSGPIVPRHRRGLAERKTGVKKTFLAVALAVAVSVAGVPAFAADADSTAPANSITISLGTLDGLVRQYNTDALVLAKNLSIARAAYKDVKGDDDPTEEAARHQYDVAQATYESSMQGIVMNARQAYLTCWHNVSLQTAAKAQADRDAKLLATAAQQLQSGYLSQKDYRTAADNATKSKQALETQTAVTSQAEQNLKAMFPVAQGVSVNILPPSDSDFDFSGVAKIDYTPDKTKMLNANAPIIQATLEYNYEKEEDDDYGLYTDSQVDAAKLAVDQATQQQTAAFLDLYNTVTASYPSYQTEQQTVQKKESDLQVDAAKLAAGYLSQKDYDQESLDLTAAKNTLENDRNSLYLSYLKYAGMTNGYSYSAGSTAGSAAGSAAA